MFVITMPMWTRLRSALLFVAQVLVEKGAENLGGKVVYGGASTPMPDDTAAAQPMARALAPTRIVQARSMCTQSQVTYTALRGVSTARFQPLPDWQQGACELDRSLSTSLNPDPAHIGFASGDLQ